MSLSSKRIIKQGLLMKRCRWSWRPRFIEIISDPPDFSGPQYSFFLLIFDQSHRTNKKRIRIEDIVTIRAGKNCSFQIYLNSGMFLLFRAESVDSQAAWMAELKMALGRGNIFHVQVSTPADNFVLDHALLYCIGVNLPNHRFGQVDRVLVVASPINDVNLHAWNLSRMKRFLIVEAGIQMELCGNCMGHRKKTVTFVMSPEFIDDCVNFLVKEARLPNERKQMSSEGPFYYSLPHNCSQVAESSEGSTPCPTYTNAEMIVLGKEGKSSSPGIYINYNVRARSQSTSTTTTVSTKTTLQTNTENKSATLQPALPPRGVMRVKEQEEADAVPRATTPLQSLRENSRQENHFNHAPYQIDHRIYVNESGRVVQEDSHVLGSGGGWEFSGKTRSFSNAPVIPPRSGGESLSRFHPVYVQENDIHTPTTPTTAKSTGFVRPEFIGRNPPCLPPRDTDNQSSPLLTRRSTSDSNLLADNNSSPFFSRRNSEYPSVKSSIPAESDRESFTQPDSPPNYNNLMYQNVPHGYQNKPHRSHSCSQGRSPSPTFSTCTDDVANADFSLITKVTFSGQILPPRNQSRPLTSSNSSNGNKRPVPVPRRQLPQLQQHHHPQQPSSTVIQCESTITSTGMSVIKDENDTVLTTVEQLMASTPAAEKDFSANPMYSFVVPSKEHVWCDNSSSTSSPLTVSPALPRRKISAQHRCNSFSSSSLSSEDYKRVKEKDFLKTYPHEI